MGDRDHSITCEMCGLQRGGLNNYKCLCDPAPNATDSEIQTGTDGWTVLRDSDIERMYARKPELAAELESLVKGKSAAKTQITECHGDVLIIAVTTDGETWVVSSTRISDNEPLACSSLHGSRAEFEAGRIFQQHVNAALQSRDPREENP